MRGRRLSGAAAAIVVVTVLYASVAAAQTTTTTPSATTESTTVATTSTTVTTTTSPPSTSAPPTTTQAPTTTSSSSSDNFPWWVVVVAVAVVVALTLVAVARSRRRARGHAVTSAWRQRATDELGEIGATARLLAGGTPVSAAIAQQVLMSLRALDDLAASAPDERLRGTVHDARQAVRSLAIAVDAQNSAQRAQPPVTPAQLDAADASLRAAAMDAEGVLRNSAHALRPGA